jgi:hypothetical protein
MMTRVEGQTITGKRIVLDGHQYVHCLFIGCELVYRGGECNFKSHTRNCSWMFEGAARNTIGMLRELGVLDDDPSGPEDTAPTIQVDQFN